MDDTVLREPYREPPPPAVRVRVDGGPEQTFTAPFTIGRGGEATLQVEAGSASREHVAVAREGNGWVLRDLGSTNGVYRDNERIKEIRLVGRVTVQLGRTGPHVELCVGDAVEEEPPRTNSELASHTGAEHEGVPSESRVMEHYFGGGSGLPAGERTQMIRKAFVKVQKKDKRKYGAFIGAALMLLVAALAVVIWQRSRLAALERQAEAIFYELKSQDLAVAQFRLAIIDAGGAGRNATGGAADSSGSGGVGLGETGRVGPLVVGGVSLEDQLARMDERRRVNAELYDGLVEQAGVYRGLTPEEVEIYRVARIFNESEFTIPAGYVSEVKRYIRYWTSTNRFENAIRHAQNNGYVQVIVETFQRYGLPPEFFYLGLQESNFETRIVGPWTRYGHAKGMWQFIPETGRRYGLATGPLVDQGVYDPLDERHDYIRAADASAHYLLDIYTELAEASGLLAMASYNWGEGRVIPRLPRLEGLVDEQQADPFAGIPQNPQQRSYWRFLNEYGDRMPQQTKDYVFYIVSAAVIGQNPRLFGFDFDNPLEPYLSVPATSAPSETEPVESSSEPLDSEIEPVESGLEAIESEAEPTGSEAEPAESER